MGLGEFFMAWHERLARGIDGLEEEKGAKCESVLTELTNPWFNNGSGQ